jgi:hypothetical protein
MDYYSPKPIQLPHEYYKKNFYLNARNAFIDQIKSKCEGKEDVNLCIEKYKKGFDAAFESLKEQLEKEDKATYQWEYKTYALQGRTIYEEMVQPHNSFY